MSQDNTTNFERVESIKHDELDLLDIIFQLWKGKIIIIAMIVVSLAGAGLYLASVKPVWTSTAIVTQPDAGQVAYYSSFLNQLYKLNGNDADSLLGGLGPFSTNILQQTQFSRFSSSLSASNTVVTSVLEKPANYPLSVSLKADTASHAQEQLSNYIQQTNTALVNEYVAEINAGIKDKISELTASLAVQQKIAEQRHAHHLGVIRYALKIAEASGISSSQLNQADNLSDDTLYLLGTHALSAMIANESNKPPLLDKQYFDTQTQLLAFSQLKPDVEKLQPFTYITPPDLPATPTAPRKSLVLLLAAILGGIAGSAIVIGRNVVADYRLRKRTV